MFLVSQINLNSTQGGFNIIDNNSLINGDIINQFEKIVTKHYKKINQAIVSTYFYNTLLKFDLTNTRRHFEPYKKLKNNTE